MLFRLLTTWVKIIVKWDYYEGKKFQWNEYSNTQWAADKQGNK